MTQPSGSKLLWNPADPTFVPDPYPTYLRLLAEPGLTWSEAVKPPRWVAARHRDVAFVLNDRRFGHSPGAESWKGSGTYDLAKPLFTLFEQWMLFRDPPDHTRLRGLVSKALTPAIIEGLRPDIQAVADRLLDAAGGRKRMELIADFALPLPVMVVAGMLGVPAEDQHLFKGWSANIAAALGIWNPGVLERGARAAAACGQYLEGITSERRRAPRNDLISALNAVEENGEKLTREAVLASCVLLLFAGHEITVNLIGNGLLTLMRHPDQLELLRREPGQIDPALEECLRYESPVQLTGRICFEEVEVGGRLVKAGQFVTTLIGAANRDPEQFPDPNRFDITRTPNPHLAFASGMHSCLGAPLARLEGQIAVGTAVRRLERMALKGEPVQWRDNVTMRGLQALPVTI
jgi:pimeloyl-[acyl-carrier protein] synthase